MTRLRFSGGEVLQVSLSVDEVREQLQAALANRTLLEIESPDGTKLVINPQQVQYFQDSREFLVEPNGNGNGHAPNGRVETGADRDEGLRGATDVNAT